MGERRWTHATLLSMACFGLILMFCVPRASRADFRAAAAVRTPKCTVDIASGKESDCTLIKAKDEWILWTNSSSKTRSVHFKSDDNPFTESSCWNVEPGARARSGPIALSAAAKTYVSYTSDVPCGSSPPSDSGAEKVIVQ
jgi:hypothetical protein